MKKRQTKVQISLLSALLAYLIFPTVTTAMQAPEQKLTCSTTSGQHVPIVEKELDAPFKIIEEKDRKIIYFDPWRMKNIPKPVLLFEQSRQCVELLSPPVSQSDQHKAELIEADKDCRAINLLREQELITYREFYEIVDFYTQWKDIEMSQTGEARRVKGFLGCYKRYNKKMPVTPRIIQRLYK